MNHSPLPPYRFYFTEKKCTIGKKEIASWEAQLNKCTFMVIYHNILWIMSFLNYFFFMAGSFSVFLFLSSYSHFLAVQIAAPDLVPTRFVPTSLLSWWHYFHPFPHQSPETRKGKHFNLFWETYNSKQSKRN